MKCRRQPRFLENRPIAINDVWEVRLPPRIWRLIKQVARVRGSTFTAVTRYCLFRLVECETLRMRRHFARCLRSVQSESRVAEDLHRHMVCFYGEDILLVKLAAMRLNISVTGLIRLALGLWLPRLLPSTHHRRMVAQADFKVLSIKRWMHIKPSGLNHGRVPMLRNFAFAGFPPWLCW